MSKKALSGFYLDYFQSIQRSYLFLLNLGYSARRFVVSTFLTLLSSLLQYFLMTLFFLLIRAMMTHRFASITKGRLLSHFFAFLPEHFSSGFRPVIVLSMILVFIKIVVLIVKTFSSYLIQLDKEVILSKLRSALYSGMLSSGKAYHDQSNFSQKIRLLEQNSFDVAESIGHLHSIFAQLGRILIILLCLFQINPLFTLVSSGSFVFIFIISKKYILEIKQGLKLIRVGNFALNEKIHGILNNLSLIKIYNMEKKENNLFNESLDKINELKRKGFFFQTLLQLMSELNVLLLLLMLALFAPYFFPLHEKISISHVLVFFIGLRMLEPSVQKVVKTLNSLDTLSLSVLQLTEQLSYENRNFVITEGSERLSSFQNEIEFKRLCFAYPAHSPVLNDISFVIKKGVFFAITGDTGSGKTTLLQLLLRLYEVPSRSIFIDGNPIENFTFDSVRSLFTLVTQAPMFFNDTIRNNLTYGLNRMVSDQELDEVTQKACIYDFIYALNKRYDCPLRQYGSLLSGGERQRLAIARALLNRTPVLILDEATSALDLNTESLIQKHILALRPESTLIMISHRMTVLGAADQVLVLKQGKVAEIGTPQELIEKKGEFYRLKELSGA